jgi:flagellar biosynthesis protein FlhB
MAGGGGGGERTEQATPKRKKEARKKGQIGNTPELGSWFGLLAASFLIPHVARSMMGTARICLVQVGAVIRDPQVGTATAAAHQAFRSAFTDVLPLALLFAMIGVLSAAGQGGLYFAAGALKPKFNRLNPLSGLKRLLGPHAWWNLTKSLLKTAGLALVVYLSVRKLIPTVMGSGSLSLESIVSIASNTILGVIRYAAVAGLLMAFADYAVVRKRNNKSLKMTKQEVKDEFKNSEGDPHVRGQRRARAMAMSRNRMMAEIPNADVVVVNPTHVAVALRYEPKKGAPRVVAKGADHVAARIRAAADTHRVPMVADIPLARTLYSSCEIGQEIPADLFRAVATVLAFVMTLRKRGSAAGVHTVRTLTPTR